MDPDFPDLIRRWLDHRDEAAARQLIDLLYPLVARVVHRHATSRDGPDDLCQEVFARFFSQLHRCSPRLPLENWTARLALNVCRNRWRHQARRPELLWEDLSPRERLLAELAWNDGDPVTPASRSDARALLLKIFETLPADDRLILSLLHLEEKDTASIASLLGWSRSLVKVRAFRARARLRRALQRLKP